MDCKKAIKAQGILEDIDILKTKRRSFNRFRRLMVESWRLNDVTLNTKQSHKVMKFVYDMFTDEINQKLKEIEKL